MSWSRTDRSKARMVPFITAAIRNDIALGPRRDLAHGENGGLLRRHLARHQALHAEKDAGRGGDRVDGEMRHGAMAPGARAASIVKASAEAMVGPVRTWTLPTGFRVVRWRPYTSSTRGSPSTPAAIMAPRPAQHFFRGLEEEHGGAGQLAPTGGQDLGQGDGDGGVPVVAAGVHDAGGAGGEGRLQDLGERQRVGVRAPGYRLAGQVAPQHAHHAGARHRLHLEPAAWSRSATICAVRCSWKDSSGCRWKSRRSATRPSRRLSASCVQSSRVLLIEILRSM